MTPVINITLKLDGEEGRRKAASLMKMCRRTPFLPVENHRLDEEEIDALAITGFSLRTLDEFPGSFVAERLRRSPLTGGNTSRTRLSPGSLTSGAGRFSNTGVRPTGTGFPQPCRRRMQTLGRTLFSAA